MRPSADEWAEIELGQLGSIVTGRTPPKAEPELFGSDYPFFTPSDMSYGDRSPPTERFISNEGAQRFRRIRLPTGSTCFVCIGATIGKACLTSQPSFTNQQLNSIIPDDERHDPRFVYYLLVSVAEDIKALASGAATPIINKSSFSSFKVKVPSLPTQQRIAAILSVYDDLIETNTRRIAILEEMARRLYEEWFVHFRFPGHETAEFDGDLPKGWEMSTLGEAAENFDRRRKPLSKMQRAERSGPYPYYGAAKVFDYIDDYIFDGRYLLLAEDGSVATPEGFPVLQFVSGKFWPNNHTHILQGIGRFSTEFLYLALSRHPIMAYVTGAAQPKITQANMNRIPITVAPTQIHSRFDELVVPLLRQVEKLKATNANLRAQRDLLLPKLVSGEIDVSGAEAALEAAE